jgi:hypothetical protein
MRSLSEDLIGSEIRRIAVSFFYFVGGLSTLALAKVRTTKDTLAR